MTTNFFHPYLLLLFLDPGWVKIRIQDKHPRSAKLVFIVYFLLILNLISFYSADNGIPLVTISALELP